MTHICVHNLTIIKSPRYTGGNYVFVPVHTPAAAAADSCSRYNFWTTFGISFICGTIVGPDLQITWLDFGRFSSWPWPWISRSSMELAISQPKMVRFPQNEKQTHRLNSRPLNVTIRFDFQGQIWNWLYLSQKWCDCHERKSKHIDWSQGLKCDHRVWPWLWTWPWIFKVKYGICYISAQTGLIATKRKANILINL